LYSIDIVFVLNKCPILSFPASTARQIAHSALIDNQNANGNGFLIFLYMNKPPSCGVLEVRNVLRWMVGKTPPCPRDRLMATPATEFKSYSHKT
jgi:hypothetical protein